MGDAEVTCTAELDGAKVTKTVTVIPISIGEIEKAEQRKIRPKDPIDLFITLDDTCKVEKVVIQYKDSDVTVEKVVSQHIDPRAANEEPQFCEFDPVGNLGSSAIKMWYKNCDDEGQFTLYDNFERSTEIGYVKGKLPADEEAGAYICCYDHKNDLNDVFAGLTAEETESICDTDKDTAAQLFQSKFDQRLVLCTGNYDNVAAAGFPWWIILVLLLIIIVVIGACWFWQKQKDKNENDPDVEAGNVEKPSAIPDGELEATQEEQQDLLDNQQQEGTK